MKTHCKNGHELTPENIVMRKNSTRPECRACRLLYSRKARGIADDEDARARRKAATLRRLEQIRAARLARGLEATERLWERYEAEGRVIYNNHVRSGSCSLGHPLTKANVYLRVDLRRDRVVAQCRECKNRRERERKAQQAGAVDIFNLLPVIFAQPEPRTEKERERQRIQEALTQRRLKA